jgi:signal transduction histidine kinase
MIRNNCVFEYTAVFLVFFSFFGDVLYAQRKEVDSITTVLRSHTANDTNKVQLLSKLAYFYHQISPDSTIDLSKYAYNLANKLNYPKGKADALKHWAIGSYIQSYDGEALNKNKEALAIYKSLGDERGEGAILNNMAMIFHNQGEYETALVYYNLSMRKRQAVGDMLGLGGVYNNIGNSYCDMGNYSKSLEYLFKGLEIREKIADSAGIANSYSNIGGVYFLLSRFDLAIKYNEMANKIYELNGNRDGIFQSLITTGGVYLNRKQDRNALAIFEKALSIAQSMGSKSSESVALVNLGEVEINLGMFDKAIKHFADALAFSSVSSDLEGIVISELGLGKAYLMQHNMKQALVHLNTGYNSAVILGNKLRLYESSTLLADAYGKKNDYAFANKFLKEAMVYKDSLLNEESGRKVHEAEFNYAMDKKQKEIELLEKDKSIQEANSQRQRTIVISMIGFVLLLIVMILLVNRNRKKEKKLKEISYVQKIEIEEQSFKLKELNALKDKTFSILSHDLRSPIAALVGVMDLMDRKLITTDDFNALKGSFGKQLKSLSLLLDNLLQWSKSHMQGHIQPHPKQLNLLEEVKGTFDLLNVFAQQKSISLVSHVSADVMVFVDKDNFDLVLRNLVANAVKFSKHNNRIELNSTTVNNTVTISIKDEGVGMKSEVLQSLFSEQVKIGYGTNGEHGTGIGLLICKEFIEKNNGTIKVESEYGKGTTFYITLPTQA